MSANAAGAGALNGRVTGGSANWGQVGALLGGTAHDGVVRREGADPRNRLTNRDFLVLGGTRRNSGTTRWGMSQPMSRTPRRRSFCSAPRPPVVASALLLTGTELAPPLTSSNYDASDSQRGGLGSPSICA